MRVRSLNRLAASSRIVFGTPWSGVLAEEVPASGSYGKGYAYDSLIFPAHAGRRIRGEIVTPPVGLTYFYPREDTSVDAAGPPGSYPFTWKLRDDGVDRGNAVATIVLEGVAGVALAGNAATFAGGTLDPQGVYSVAIAGNAAAFAVGILTPATGTASGLTGNLAMFSGGTPGANVTVSFALAGNAATFAAGTPMVGSAINLALTGAAATFSAGNVAPALIVNLALAGGGATFSAGTPAAWTATQQGLTGRLASFAAGSVNAIKSTPGSVYPDPADVAKGVVYGPNGADYTGSKTGGGGGYVRRR